MDDRYNNQNGDYNVNGSLKAKENQPAVVLCSSLLCGLSTDPEVHLDATLDKVFWSRLTEHQLIIIHPFKTGVNILLPGKNKPSVLYRASSCSRVKGFPTNRTLRNLLNPRFHVRRRWRWRIVCSDTQEQDWTWMWTSPFYLAVLNIINVMSRVQWKKWRLY